MKQFNFNNNSLFTEEIKKCLDKKKLEDKIKKILI